MPLPFKLRSTLARSRNVDLDDTARIKKALNGLGYYRVPKHGFTPYPDEATFASIEAFQRDHGLREDGLMRPDGQTASKLGHVLGEQAKRRWSAAILPNERQ